MTLPRLNIDAKGNDIDLDSVSLTYDSITNARVAGNLQPVIVTGTGTPAATLTAPKGSLFIRLDGSSGATRAYINTDGATAWTNVTTAG